MNFKGRQKNFKALMMLGLALLIAIIAACSSGNENNSAPQLDNSSNQSGGENDGPYAEHLEITWMGFNQIGIVNPGTDSLRNMLEERFNVTIHTPQVDIHNMEQVNLYFAEGQTADYIALNHFYDNLIRQGVFQEINMDEAREKMPNWFAALEANVDYETLKATTQYNGKNYYLPYGSYSSAVSHVMGVRQDWLDNLGMDMPQTLDEYTEMLRRFTYDDPDRNGIDDTYGTHNIGAYVYGAFGIPVTGKNGSAEGMPFYVDDNGQVYPVAISENKKEMLKQVRAWYEEGLIDPEFVTDDRARQRSKWKEGKFGVLSDNPWWFAYSTNDNLKSMVEDFIPGAKVTFMEPFEGPYGQGSTGRAYSPTSTAAVYFGRDTSPEKVDRIMAMKEAMAAEDELYMSLFYGEEGVAYHLDEDGKIVVEEEYTDTQKLANEGLGQFYALRPLTLDFAKEFIISNDDLIQYEIGQQANFYPIDVNFAFAGVNEALIEHRGDLYTIVEEFDVRAITGKVDIDAEWDNFVELFMSAGGQEVVDEYQRLYDESN